MLQVSINGEQLVMAPFRAEDKKTLLIVLTFDLLQEKALRIYHCIQ